MSRWIKTPKKKNVSSSIMEQNSVEKFSRPSKWHCGINQFENLRNMKQENLKKKKIRVLEEGFGNSPGCADRCGDDGSQRWWNSIESDDVVVANRRHHHNRLLEAARLLANNTTCGFNWQEEETHSYFSSVAPFGHPTSKMSSILWRHVAGLDSRL